MRSLPALRGDVGWRGRSKCQVASISTEYEYCLPDVGQRERRFGALA